MIGDGYDFHGTIISDGITIRCVYRPMLAHERRVVLKTAGLLRGYAGERLVFHESSKRVVLWSLDWPCDADGLEELEDRHPDAFLKLWRKVCGLDDGSWEKDSADNLRQGVELLVKHPYLKDVSCDTCRKWWLSDKFERCFDGGEPLLRPDNLPVLCETTTGCPVGHWGNQKRLSAMNVLAVDRHLECRAVGRWPEDAIVKRNACIIESALGRANGPAKANPRNNGG